MINVIEYFQNSIVLVFLLYYISISNFYCINKTIHFQWIQNLSLLSACDKIMPSFSYEVKFAEDMYEV